MHTYDVPRRQPYPIPSARPAQDSHGGPSATPIYDTLYAEYVKSFRSLPGDRSGEEELGFTAFGNIPYSTGSYAVPRPGSFSSSYSAYSAGAQSARLGGQPSQGQAQGQSQAQVQVQVQVQPQSQWQRVGPLGQTSQTSQTGQQQTPTGTHHLPALPPAPRRSG
ncbi:hypothetical protein CP966_07365 [Streptomyces galilaeus]|uniref:Uncharacterized protein n=1 Tax=Streptomyces bobili TaxID=67280 RepID=A0ABZ1R6L4_9ACTN|nr:MULTISPECIES: hypothetical protein [Streptomyces]QEU65105.1 hypothetical protein CP966_07365 [Streptomyces galilaeus]GGW41869.1 hypothetical protein GCM10010350_27080 [Streptomyces galilaeus]